MTDKVSREYHEMTVSKKSKEIADLRSRLASYGRLYARIASFVEIEGYDIGDAVESLLTRYADKDNEARRLASLFKSAGARIAELERGVSEIIAAYPAEDAMREIAYTVLGSPLCKACGKPRNEHQGAIESCFGPGDDRPSCYTPPLSRIAQALENLQFAESQYRYYYEAMGGDHIKTGVAWDSMRNRGDEARAVLAKKARRG